MLSGLLLLAGRALASPAPDDAVTDRELLALDEALAELDEETDFTRDPLDVGALLVAGDAIVTASGLVDPDTLAETRGRRAASGASWGRLDVTLAWRRSDRTDARPGDAVAIAGAPGVHLDNRREELWLVATWRH